MLSWGVILYGAILSAVVAVVLVLLARERAPAVLIAAAASALLGPLAWNAILSFTAASQFFVDAPVPLFPVSWQDTGSGVFAVAAAAPLLGFLVPPATSAKRVAILSLLCGLAALVVDVYLY
jgi:hypothetical protein